MLNVTVFCFFASYLLALVFEISRAVGQRPWLRWPAFFAALAGLVAHTFFLWNRGRALDLAPLLASPQDWMFVVAWIACVLYLFVVAYDRRVGIGLFALPVVLLFVVVGNFASDSTRAGIAAEQGAFRGWLLLHAALLGLGIAAVMAGIVLSVMYLVQHNRLKHKRAPMAGLKLLSLERLAQWNHFAILIAVPLLTLGLAVGVLLVFLGRQQGTNLTLYDPFVIASSLAWLAMIVVLGHALRAQQAVGKTVAIRTLLGFGLLLITLLGLQLATGGGHTQGGASEVGGRESGTAQESRPSIFMGGPAATRPGREATRSRTVRFLRSKTVPFPESVSKCGHSRTMEHRWREPLVPAAPGRMTAGPPGRSSEFGVQKSGIGTCGTWSRFQPTPDPQPSTLNPLDRARFLFLATDQPKLVVRKLAHTP